MDKGLERTRDRVGSEPRRRLLAGLPVTERRLQLNGISTAVLEGGDGPPVVLLHGPGEYGVKWWPIIPNLATTHHVVAPDLPGHGATDHVGRDLDSGRVLAWLDDLIECTCSKPPVLVGHVLGGAIAARFAASQGERIERLVLVDTLGLAPFQPTPDFAQALERFLEEPTEETHDLLLSRCAFDLEALRTRIGEKWLWMKSYNLDRARTPALKAPQQSLMQEFGFPAIPPEALARIAVPTALVWGRHDRATALSVAETASVRYGWPLHVIENGADDPAMDQPEAFLEAFYAVLDDRGRNRSLGQTGKTRAAHAGGRQTGGTRV